MDWKRAIKILIISFIIVNIALIANLYLRKQPKGRDVVKEEAYDIEEILDSRGIFLKTKMPQEGKPQSFLEVKHGNRDKDFYVKLFFGEDVPQVSYEKNRTTYTVGERQLDFINNGIIYYKNQQKPQTKDNLSEKEAREFALNFIKNHGGLPADAVLGNVFFDEKNGEYHIKYVQKFDDFIIANSYIKVTVALDQIKSFERCWLVPIEYQGEEKKVISPLSAVLKAAEERQKGPKAITIIEQGFYSKLYNADSWQMAPVWIIGFEDGKTYYINSYTGQLEI